MAGERRDPTSPPAGGMYYHYHARNAPYNHAYRPGRVHRMEDQWNSASSVPREGVGGRSILPNPSSSHRDFRRQRSSFEASEEVGGGWMRRGVVVSEEPRGGGLIDRSSRPPRNHPAFHHQWAIDYHTSSSDGWLGMSGSTEAGGSSSHDHQPMNQLDWSRAQDPLTATPPIPPFQSKEKLFEAKDRTTAHWQKAEYPELAPAVLTRADLTTWQREPSSSSAFVVSETGEYSESTPAELRAVQWPRGGGGGGGPLSVFTSSEHTEGGSASASETGEHSESTRKTYTDEDPFFLPAEEAFGRLSKPGRASLDTTMAGHRSKKCSLGGRYEIGSSSDPVASSSSSSSPSFPSEFSSDRWRSKRAAKGKAPDGSEASRGGVGGRSVVASASVGCLAGWNPKEKARERRRNLPKHEAEFPPRQADNTNNRFGMMRRHCVTESDSITPPPPPPSVVVDGLHIASASTSGQGSIPRRGRRVGGPRLSGNASFSSRAMFGKRLSHRSAGFGMYQLPRDSSSSPRPNVDSYHPSSSSTPPLEDGIFPLPPNFSAPPPPTRPPPLPNPAPLSFLGPSDAPTHMQTSGPRSIYRQSGHHSSQMTGFAAFSEGHYSREQSPPSDALLFRPPHGIEFQPVRNNWFHSVVEELSQILSSWGHGDRDEDFSYEHIFWEDGTFTLDRTGILDQHRDMRLDVDNMSYEELLALEEKIGNVSTGLDEKKIGACLQRRKYVALEVGNGYPTPDEVEVKCSICQDEFEENAEIGVLECRHSFHIPCIQQWLLHKNQCPVCKASAL